MNKEAYFENVDWLEDLQSQEEINRIIDGYEDTDEPEEDYELHEIDFENDPDAMFLREYADDIADEHGNSKVGKIENWKYFVQTKRNMGFYREKARYIMRNYSFHKAMIEGSLAGRLRREMPHEMFKRFKDDCDFFEKCLHRELAGYYVTIHLKHFGKLSIRNCAEVSGINKGSVENDLGQAYRVFARLLAARDLYRFNGAKIFDKAIGRENALKEIEVDEGLELIGKLASLLKSEHQALKKKKQVS